MLDLQHSISGALLTSNAPLLDTSATPFPKQLS